ncbi:MAG: hypothetical protein ABI599_04215, partial [Flavobacteriales bacterium]
MEGAAGGELPIRRAIDTGHSDTREKRERQPARYTRGGAGHPIIAVGRRPGAIEGTPIVTE